MLKKHYLFLVIIFSLFCGKTSWPQIYSGSASTNEHVDKKIETHLGEMGEILVKLKNELCHLSDYDKISEVQEKNIGLDFYYRRLKKYKKEPEEIFQSIKMSFLLIRKDFRKIEIIGSKTKDNEINYDIYFQKGLRNISLMSHIEKKSKTGECTIRNIDRFYIHSKGPEELKFLKINEHGEIEQKHSRYVMPKTLREIYGDDQEKLNQALEAQSDSQRVKVGLIDTGVDYNHPGIAYKINRTFDAKKEDELLKKIQENSSKNAETQFREKLVLGFNLKYKNKSPFDYDGFKYKYFFFPYLDTHGTSVAHALTRDTDKIVVLPAKFDQLNILSIKKAIKLLAKEKVKVINMSIGINRLFKVLTLGIKKEMQKHSEILFVVSASNDGSNKKSYPAAFVLPNLISVGASTKLGKLAEYSNYGTTVDMAALGDQMLFESEAYNRTQNEKTLPPDLVLSQGTSFSSPTVARLAALMLYKNPKLSPEKVKKILCDTVDKKKSFKGKMNCPGVINEKRALEMSSK